MHPELKTGRNEVEFELPPGHKHQAAWLDPELPATFELVEDVLAGIGGIFAQPASLPAEVCAQMDAALTLSRRYVEVVVREGCR